MGELNETVMAVRLLATGDQQFETYLKVQAALPGDESTVREAAVQAIVTLLQGAPLNPRNVGEIVVSYWDHDLNRLKRALNGARAWDDSETAAMADAMIEHVSNCRHGHLLEVDSTYLN